MQKIITMNCNTKSKIDKADFILESEKTIHKIADTIEDADIDGMIDIDLNDATLILGTAKGVFVINRQSIAKEIWLSSPISGPYHFAYKEGFWLSRSGVELFDILTKELQVEFL